MVEYIIVICYVNGFVTNERYVLMEHKMRNMTILLVKYAQNTDYNNKIGFRNKKSLKAIQMEKQSQENRIFTVLT